MAGRFELNDWVCEVHKTLGGDTNMSCDHKTKDAGFFVSPTEMRTYGVKCKKFDRSGRSSRMMCTFRDLSRE